MNFPPSDNAPPLTVKAKTLRHHDPFHSSSELRMRAWIGDAILHYHARCLILGHFRMQLGWVFTRMTNNENLKRFGTPRGFGSGTQVEAEIYRLHREGGDKAQRFCEEIFEFTIAQFTETERELMKANAEKQTPFL